VVEVRVAAVEEGGEAAGFDVADEFCVFGFVEGEVGVTRERGDGEDGLGEAVGGQGGDHGE
jgi:hypothetical protein